MAIQQPDFFNGNKEFTTEMDNHPPKTAFDLTYARVLSCKMGKLYPVHCEEAVPGDIWTIRSTMVARMMPTVAPVMHEIDAYIHFYFVPNRILWDQWEDFVTGGKDGTFTAELPISNIYKAWYDSGTTNDARTLQGTLYDYLDMPIKMQVRPTGEETLPAEINPVAFPVQGVNKIYNEYYRDANIIEERDLNDATLPTRAWEKDYFTSALPWRQRGIAPAINLVGTAPVQFKPVNPDDPTSNAISATVAAGTGNLSTFQALYDAPNPAGSGRLITDLSESTGFDVAEMRYAFAIQRYLEQDARGGSRYIENLKAHHGISPDDKTLQRPEYLGGTKTPIYINEVLQTSATTDQSPQANFAGYGGAAGGGEAVKNYLVEEPGYIIGLMSILPKPMYEGGLDAKYIKKTRYSYYSPELANLSEEPIKRAEIMYRGNKENDADTLMGDSDTFGYQGIFDYLRIAHNKVNGLIRPSANNNLAYWTMTRSWNPNDATNWPKLNDTFINCNPPAERIFTVTEEDQFVMTIGHDITALRQLPEQPVPGGLDTTWGGR